MDIGTDLSPFKRVTHVLQIQLDFEISPQIGDIPFSNTVNS